MDQETLRAAGLQYVVDGAVATITLDRPERRNAQTPTMWRTLAALGEAIPDEVRVLLLKGSGESFSAGLDTAMLDPRGGDGQESVVGLLAMSDQEMADTIEVYQRGFTFLRDPRFISIAAVQGHAVGAGFQIALSCDLRVVADDVSFCMKEAALGLVPDLTGTQPLVEIVGYSRALEICCTARRIGADEAARLGLATVVVPRADLDGAVDDLVAALTSALPGVAKATKPLLQGALDRTLDEQRRLEREAQVGRFREVAALMGQL